MELLQPILVIVVGYLLRAAMRTLKWQLDEAAFASLVAAIVVYLLALIGVDTAARFLGG